MYCVHTFSPHLCTRTFTHVLYSVDEARLELRTSILKQNETAGWGYLIEKVGLLKWIFLRCFCFVYADSCVL